MDKKIFTVREAVEYQKAMLGGRAPFGRDALYAAIRSETLKGIWVGRRRVYITRTSLDDLLGGVTVPSGRR